MRPLFADPVLRRWVFLRTSLSAHNSFCHESWALFVKPHLIGSMKQGSPILLSNKFNLRHKKLYKRAISLGQWFTSQITSKNIGCLAKTSARMKNKEDNRDVSDVGVYRPPHVRNVLAFESLEIASIAIMWIQTELSWHLIKLII